MGTGLGGDIHAVGLGAAKVLHTVAYTHMEDVQGHGELLGHVDGGVDDGGLAADGAGTQQCGVVLRAGGKDLLRQGPNNGEILCVDAQAFSGGLHGAEQAIDLAVVRGRKDVVHALTVVVDQAVVPVVHRVAPEEFEGHAAGLRQSGQAGKIGIAQSQAPNAEIRMGLGLDDRDKIAERLRRVNGRGAVGHFEHGGNTGGGSRRGGGTEILLLTGGQTAVAGVNVGLDQAGQDIAARSVRSFTDGAGQALGRDGGDPAVTNVDIGTLHTAIVDHRTVVDDSVPVHKCLLLYVYCIHLVFKRSPHDRSQGSRAGGTFRHTGGRYPSCRWYISVMRAIHIRHADGTYPSCRWGLCVSPPCRSAGVRPRER